MGPSRIAAIVLIAVGSAVLIYRGFTYTRHHDVDVGPFDVKYDDRETVHIPVWTGVSAIGLGTAILLARRTG